MNCVAVVLSDLHYNYHDPKYINIATKLIKQLNPDHVIQGGDALDASGISSYLKPVDKEARLFHEIEAYNEQLDEWQSIMKKGSYFHQLEGNHSERLHRYVAKNCREIHEIIKPIPELLRLKERSKNGVKFIWHPLNQWDSCQIGDVYFHHGTYFDKHIAVSNLTRYGVKFVQFHAHRFAYASDGKIWSACLGHGSDPRKTAHIHAPNTWQQCIGVVTWVKGKGSLEPILISNGECVFRGKIITG